MPDVITIQGEEVGIGEQRELELNVARLPTYTTIDLPVHIYRGESDGPVLLLTGGLHGDEINGIEIIRRMIESGQVMPEQGTVIAIPLVNIYGFILNERGVPDGKDINRSFPGVRSGSLAKLLAYTLMNEIIPQVDYGIDFHTGSVNRSNYPQIRCSFESEKNIELAQAFQPPIIVHSKLIEKSFRKAAHKKEKQILVYETGEALRFDENGIREGIAGTLRLMKYLEMRSTAPEPAGTESFEKTSWIRAGNAGLFQPEVELGESVEKKQLLGRITDPFGKESFKVVSSKQGRVIGLNNGPVVHKGDAILNLAYNKTDLSDR